jgi:hypothetical protein
MQCLLAPGNVAFLCLPMLPVLMISKPWVQCYRFDTVYIDNRVRVAKDIRGDTLIVSRDGPPRSFE